MQEATRARWIELCAEAGICEDPERLQEIIESLNAILKEEQKRLETDAQERWPRSA